MNNNTLNILFYVYLFLNFFISINTLYTLLKKIYKYKKLKNKIKDKYNLQPFDEIIKKYDIYDVDYVFFYENEMKNSEIKKDEKSYTLSIKFLLEIDNNNSSYIIINFAYKDIIEMNEEEIEIYFKEKIRQKKLKNKIEKLKNNIKMK